MSSFIPAALALGGGILQGLASVQEGNAAKAAADARRQELDREAQLQKIAATETQASILRELNINLGSVDALLGSRGLDLSSPSAVAISSSMERDARRDARRTAFNANQQASNLRLAGQAALNSGRAARTAGYLRAGGSLFKAATETNSLFG